MGSLLICHSAVAATASGFGFRNCRAATNRLSRKPRIDTPLPGRATSFVPAQARKKMFRRYRKWQSPYIIARKTRAYASDAIFGGPSPVSYTHLRAHETPEHLVCRLLLEK